MKASRINLVLSGLTLAVSLAGQVAWAGEPTGPKGDSGPAPQSEPSAADIKNSKDRGLIFNTVNTGVGAGVTAPAVPVAKPPLPIAKPPVAIGKENEAKHTKPVKQVKTATTSTTKKPVAPSVQSPKTKPAPTVVQTESTGKGSGAVTVSHQVVSSGEGAIVKAWFNKTGATPVYKVGEKMTINVSASEDCNLVVFDFDGKTSLKQIFPNEYQQNGAVRAGETVSIGGTDSPFDYQVGGAGGVERIFIYAYPSATSSSPLSVAMLPAVHSPFRAAEMSLDQYRDLVNKSKVFFSREVKIVPKANFKPVSDTSSSAPNKIELTFNVQP